MSLIRHFRERAQRLADAIGTILQIVLTILAFAFLFGACITVGAGLARLLEM